MIQMGMSFRHTVTEREMRYTMNAIRLKTEYLKNPIGMDIVKPQLFWNCAEGVRQTAYRIVCRDEHENVL